MDFTGIVTDIFIITFIFTLISYGKVQTECGVDSDKSIQNDEKTICLGLYHDRTTSWGEARAFCENRGGRLVWDDSAEKHLLIHYLVQHFNEAETAFWWIGGKERRRDQWMLVNGQPDMPDHDGNNLLDVDEGRCTAYWYDGHEEGPKRRHLACAEEHPFICETSSALHDRELIGNTLWETASFQGKDYYLSTRKYAWHVAQAICREYGMTLFTNKDVVPQFNETLVAFNEPGWMLWFGSSRSRWDWISGNDTEMEMEGDQLWYEWSFYRQAQPTEEKCVYVVPLTPIQHFVYYDYYAWRVWSCNRETGFICEFDMMVTSDRSPALHARQTDSEGEIWRQLGNSRGYIIGVLVIAVLFFLISCGLCAFIIFTHYKRLPNKSNQPSNTVMGEDHARVSHDIRNIYREADDANTDDNARAHAEKNEATKDGKNVKHKKHISLTEADPSHVYANNLRQNGADGEGGGQAGQKRDPIHNDTMITENTSL